MTYVRKIILTSLISVTYLLTGCGEEYLQNQLPWDLRKDMDPTVVEGARFYKDIPYGEEDRQKFDFIIP